MKRIRTFRWTIWGLSVAALIGCSSHEFDSLAYSDSNDVPKGSSSKDDRRLKQNDSGHHEHTNRLAREISPYLLLHAHNPVDWYPWGPEAFEKAKRDGKPIFLSIGYSSCYWCHVMERKVFSDEKIAAYMNEHFVNIKVDREERPDIDDIYMTSLNIYFQLIGSNQGGGWPLSMFLTPEGKPIAGGTYIPPKDERGRMGFPTVMKNIVGVWEKQRESVEQNAAILTQHVQRVMKPRFVISAVKIDQDLVNNASRALLETFDPVYGGIDFDPRNPNRPKFPVPTKLALLQYFIHSQNGEKAAKVVYHTLDKIAAGGIHDHLAGGFHRYSTDRAWLVPHFEKMLYDNAQLMDVYVEAYRQTNKPLYREVVEAIAGYVFNQMTDPQGGFYSALDAETDAVEGKYYVWSHKEVDDILGQQEAELFKTVFGMHEDEVFEYGYVLNVPKPLNQVAAEQKLTLTELKTRIRDQRQKMLAARSQRKSPFRDDKILTSWNGLMIRALAHAGNVLGRDDYIAAAERAAHFVLSNMRDSEGRLLRTYRVKQAKLNAYLDDYSFLIEGLLSLYEATGDDKWLNASRRLTEDQIKLFWDEKSNGFFFTSHHHEELLARTKNAYDSVLPSGNSVSVRNLVRLSSISKQPKYRNYAQKILELFAPKLKEQPRSMTNMALAMAEFLDSATVDEPPQPKSAAADPNEEDRTIIPISDEAKADGKKKKKDETVTAIAYLSVDNLPAGGKCSIVVFLDIQKGWHINTNPAKPDYLIPTTFTIKSKRGTKLNSVRYPAGSKLRIDGFEEPVQVYEKRAAIYGILETPDHAAGQGEEIEISIRFQPCNDKQCLRPKTIILTGKLHIAGQGERVKQINQRLFSKSKTPD